MKLFDSDNEEILSGKFPLYLSWLIILFFFLVPRLPFWAHYYFPVWHPDTSTYFGPLHQLLEGQWPRLDIRPPGYLLFLLPMLKIKGIALIPVAQAIVTLASSLFFSYAVFRSSKRLTVVASLVVGFYISTDTVLNYDVTLLPESLYTSGLIVYVGVLFLFIRKSETSYLYWLSFITVVILLLRPAGLFLVVICVMAATFQTAQKKSVLRPFLSLVPLLIMVLAVCSYNRATMGTFSFVPFGAVSLAGATCTHWEQDASLPLRFNEFIRQHNLTIIPEDRMILAESWDPVLLYQVYSKYFDPTIGRGFLARQRNAEGYQAMKKMARIAITSHPKEYFKFFMSQVVIFFRNSEAEILFYPNLGTQFDLVLARRTYNETKNFERYYLDFVDYLGLPANYEIPGRNDLNGKVVLKDTWLKDIHEQFSSALRSVLRGPVWIFLYFVSVSFGVFRLIKSKYSCESSFLLTAIGFIPLGSATLVALSQRGLSRYWYPTEFAFYLTIAIAVFTLCSYIQSRYKSEPEG